MTSLLVLLILFLAIAIPLWVVFKIAFAIRNRFFPSLTSSRSRPRRGGAEGIRLGRHWFGAPYYDDDRKDD